MVDGNVELLIPELEDALFQSLEGFMVDGNFRAVRSLSPIEVSIPRRVYG